MSYNSNYKGWEIQAKLEKIDQLNAGMEDTDETVEDVVALSGATPVVDHGTSDTTFTLTSGVIHKWGIVSNLTLNIPEDSEGEVKQYRVVMTIGMDFTLSLPDTLVWDRITIPVFKLFHTYTLNIEGGRISYGEFEYTEGQRLDWIENDNIAWDYITTDITPQVGDTGCEAKGTCYVIKAGAASLCGARVEGAYTSTDMCCMFTASSTYLDWAQKRTTSGYTIPQSFVFNKTNTPLTAVKSNLPINIFSCNGDDDGLYGHMRFYYLKIFGADGGVRVNLVPFKYGEYIVIKDTISGNVYASNLGKVTGGYDE